MGLFVILLNLILPQYLVLNYSKKLFWFYLNDLIIKIKFFFNLAYVHAIIASTFFVKSMLKKIKTIKLFIDSFSKKYLKFFKLNFTSFIKIFFYKNIFLLNNNSLKKNLINTFGQKYKLNFS